MHPEEIEPETQNSTGMQSGKIYANHLNFYVNET